MSARTLAPVPTLIRPRPPLRARTSVASAAGPAAAATYDATAPSTAAIAVRLTGTSMRILEVSLAATAIATALLAGAGR